MESEHDGPVAGSRPGDEWQRLKLHPRPSSVLKCSAQTPVFHLPRHDERDVVRLYMEKNPELEQLTLGGVTQHFADHGLEEAWRDVADEYDVEHAGGGGEMDAEPCPMCGEPVKMLPEHLPCD